MFVRQGSKEKIRKIAIALTHKHPQLHTHKLTHTPTYTHTHTNKQM